MHAAKEGLLNFGNIARATASSTSGVGSSRCSTSAVTAVALNISWQTNLLFHSVGYIMECNAHFHTQIGTTALLRASTSGTETAAKAAAKNITEMSEYVLHRHAAAKTGTAQTGDVKNDNGVFVCYAPYDDPQIAVAIVIEKGGTGAALASSAVDILNAYFSSADEGSPILGENALVK